MPGALQLRTNKSCTAIYWSLTAEAQKVESEARGFEPFSASPLSLFVPLW
jgi:hypothetical protein